MILIDNGSFECRAGWNTEALPQVIFRNQVAKPKTLVNREIDQCHLVGEEFSMFDPSKIQKKQIFDKEVPTNVGLMEHVFDKCF